MSHLHDYLSSRDTESVEAWIQEVESKQYKLSSSLHKKAKKAMKLPYKVIGCGKKRIVYDLEDGWVLKVAIAYSGIKNNNTEVEFYESAPPELQELLAKVKDSGHGWIIMKKITKNVPKKDGVRSKIKKIQKKFNKEGIAPNDLISNKGRIRWPNIRLKKGKIIVIDYGNFKWK